MCFMRIICTMCIIYTFSVCKLCRLLEDPRLFVRKRGCIQRPVLPVGSGCFCRSLETFRKFETFRKGWRRCFFKRMPFFCLFTLKKDKKRRPSSRRYQKAFGERRVGRDREFLLCLFFIKQTLCQLLVFSVCSIYEMIMQTACHFLFSFFITIFFYLILQSSQGNSKDIGSFSPVAVGHLKGLLYCLSFNLFKFLKFSTLVSIGSG